MTKGFFPSLDDLWGSGQCRIIDEDGERAEAQVVSTLSIRARPPTCEVNQERGRHPTVARTMAAHRKCCVRIRVYQWPRPLEKFRGEGLPAAERNEANHQPFPFGALQFHIVIVGTTLEMKMPHIPENRTYWNETATATDFPQLSEDLNVDVAIIGGGIVGITTARMLKDMGQTVAVIEARRVGRQVTGKSTAKITSQHSIIYQTLEQKFGEDQARLYADAQESAIRKIQSLAAHHGIDCDIETKSAYAYTRDESYVSKIREGSGDSATPRASGFARSPNGSSVRRVRRDPFREPGPVSPD